MGGAWKRLIYLTRRIPCALMNKQVVTDEVLNTLMTVVCFRNCFQSLATRRRLNNLLLVYSLIEEAQ